MGSTKVREEIKKEEQKEKKPVKPIKKEKTEDEMRAIVRVSGTDLNGEKKLIVALTGVKGVSYSLCKAIINAAAFNPNQKLGSLNEIDIGKLETIIKEPEKYGIPGWMLNRRKDRATGKDIHLTSADLDIVRKFDVRRMIDMKSYKGTRHMLGLPVRGQRTRSKFRKGRSVGVVRKSIVQAQAATQKTEKKEEKK